MQNKTKFSPLKNSSKSLLINKVQDTDRRSSHVKKVVKAKNLIAFRIWLEKLGYSVKNLADGKGFTFSFKKNMA